MAMLGRGTMPPGSPQRALQRFQNCISFLFPGQILGSHAQQQQQSKSQRMCSANMDAIDCFTNELVSSKTKKWEDFSKSFMQGGKKQLASVDVEAATIDKTSLELESKPKSSSSFGSSVGLMTKAVVNDIQSLRSPQLGLDTRTLSQAQLDNLLLSTLEIKNKLDFLYLIRQCIRWQQLPSNEVLVSCLKYLSTLCKVQQIESLGEICQKQKHPIVKLYADLAPFKAMALWKTGGADVALLTLHRGYTQSSCSDEGRRMIRNAFRTIAEDTLGGKSEAVLVSLMEVARSIYNEHKDIFVVACVWKQCFISHWFCDQKSAADLFEHYKELQQLVGKRSNSLCASFLSRGNVDAVHRLIELFLQYDQKEGCSNCLALLFNYQYLRKDLRACAEIVKSCSELNLPLSEMQNEQFLSLFLDQNDLNGREYLSNSSRPASKSQNKPLKTFQYKF